MSSSPKIIVLKMREIIYTAVLFFLVALLIICMILMFSHKQENDASTENVSESIQLTQEDQENTSSPLKNAMYMPGVYTSAVTLGTSAVDVEVTVDSSQIKGIRLVNLSESVTVSYPLISPALEHIAAQILEKQSLEEITCPQENRYTSQLLLSAVSDALAQAAND